jgi:D-beta-D-heptose 7-phosphate kinase / D-beta-D-heptose 1-phosphate adenosyltransferase
MKQPTIAVFGDWFYDTYYVGTSTRISPEAPIPVVKVRETLTFSGGAANVVNNLEALGAIVPPATMWEMRPSIKNRLMVDNYQLARWDENDEQQEWDLDKIKRTIADAVIISDYGKGSITYAVIEEIAKLDLPTFIDTKRSPRDYDIVMNPTFFPNQKEYEQYMHDYRVQPKVVYKRGADGIQYMEFGKVLKDYPAWASKVVSVTGAGDTVAAAFVYATLQKFVDPLGFANRAAALVVEKPWTATTTIAEMNERFGCLALPEQIPA